MFNQKQITEAVAEVLTLPPSDIDLEASLKDDLGLNPVEIADLLYGMSQKFHIMFDPQETVQLNTVGDLVDMIEDKLLD